MAVPVYLSGERIQGRSDDSVAGTTSGSSVTPALTSGSGYSVTSASIALKTAANGVTSYAYDTNTKAIEGVAVKWYYNDSLLHTSAVTTATVFAKISNYYQSTGGHANKQTTLTTTDTSITWTLTGSGYPSTDTVMNFGADDDNSGANSGSGFYDMRFAFQVDGASKLTNLKENGSNLTPDNSLPSSAVATGDTFKLEWFNPVAKDKSTITNVPAGTRYEETDTRKIYRMKLDLVSGTGLRAYYNCDSATVDNNAALVTGNDTLGSSANATNSNVTLDTTNEKLGTGCLDFNGTDGKLSIPAQANLVEGLTEWSVSFWVWADDWSAVTDKLIMSQWDTSGSDGAVFRIEPQTNQKINVRIRKDDNQATSYTGGTACNGDGTWNHIVFNFYEDSGQKGQLYINGSADSAGVVSFPNDMRANADDTPLYIGTDSSGYFSGKFDEISFWSRKLTTAEITLLYNSGDGMNLESGLPVWKEKGTA